MSWGNHERWSKFLCTSVTAVLANVWFDSCSMLFFSWCVINILYIPVDLCLYITIWSLIHIYPLSITNEQATFSLIDSFNQSVHHHMFLVLLAYKMLLQQFHCVVSICLDLHFFYVDWINHRPSCWKLHRLANFTSSLSLCWPLTPACH